MLEGDFDDLNEYNEEEEEEEEEEIELDYNNEQDDEMEADQQEIVTTVPPSKKRVTLSSSDELDERLSQYLTNFDPSLKQELFQKFSNYLDQLKSCLELFHQSRQEFVSNRLQLAVEKQLQGLDIFVKILSSYENDTGVVLKKSTKKITSDACIMTQKLKNDELSADLLATIRDKKLHSRVEACGPIVLRLAFRVTPIQAKNFFPIIEKNKSAASEVSLNYYKGRAAAIQGLTKEAEMRFTLAYDRIPMYSTGKLFENKRRIFERLVPLKLLQGYYPKKEILQKLKLEHIESYYGDLIQAARSGDMARLEIEYEKREAYFSRMDSGKFLKIYLQAITNQHVLRAVCVNNHISLRPLANIWRAKFETEYLEDPEERLEYLICTLSELIARGLVSGYISYEQGGVLVLSKKTPFPKIRGANPKEFREWLW